MGGYNEQKTRHLVVVFCLFVVVFLYSQVLHSNSAQMCSPSMRGTRKDILRWHWMEHLPRALALPSLKVRMGAHSENSLMQELNNLLH